MTPGLVAAIAAFAFVSSITPGPNNMMLMASGANFGVRASLPHMAGVSLGFGVMVLAVGLGLAGIVSALPWLHGVLRWFGAAYLLWLAIFYGWRSGSPRRMGSDRKPPRPGR